MRALSGIQPSGKIHLGNYFGAIRQHIDLQDPQMARQVAEFLLRSILKQAADGALEADPVPSLSPGEATARVAESMSRLQSPPEPFYFIANFHALTSIRSAEELRRLTLDVALDYLALGLDPDCSNIYRQSDVPQVAELSWLLTTVTPMGLLERCHAYKDKIAKGQSADHGLFAYPVLMAADILIVDADVVPVGQDQKQHIEVTRDIAQRFNNTYGEVFTLPEPYIVPDVAIVPGTDGQKMSKSYRNTIDVFAQGKELKAQVMGIVTDSTPLEAPKDPEKDNVLGLMKLLAGADEIADWERRYRAGGTGYGHAKLRLLELINERFGAARARRLELSADLASVEKVLQNGAERARAEATKVLRRAREACGID